MARFSVFIAGVLACGAASCTSTQNEINTVEMADGVSHIREVQVLRNISAAITDHDMVPSEVLLGQGTSTIDLGTSSSLVAFPFSSAAKEFDLEPTDVWHAQWAFTSVTDANDLRRLRNLYALVASSDAQYGELESYLDRHKEPVSTTPCEQILSNPNMGHERNPTIGAQQGSAPSWAYAVCVMKMGDSIGCKLFQERRVPGNEGTYPIRRWLYWRQTGGTWLPNAPDAEPQSLGTYGDWELGATSRACFDDFIILVEGQLQKTEEKGKDTKITATAPQ